MTDAKEEDPFGAPLRHLQRACPPWTRVERTICGRPLSDVASWLPFEEAKVLVSKHGRRRAEFLFCSTCLGMHGHRMQTEARWDTDPAGVVADWAAGGRWRDGVKEQTRTELHALAALVAAHREEYDALVDSQATDELGKVRRSKRGAR